MHRGLRCRNRRSHRLGLRGRGYHSDPVVQSETRALPLELPSCGVVGGYARTGHACSGVGPSRGCPFPRPADAHRVLRGGCLDPAEWIDPAVARAPTQTQTAGRC